MGMQDISLDWFTLHCNSTTPVFIPITGWMGVAALSKGRGTVEMRNRYGNIQAKLAMQFADVENAPGSVVELTDAIASNTVLYPTSTGYVSLSATAEDSQLGRLGYYVSNTSGVDLSLAQIAARVQLITE